MGQHGGHPVPLFHGTLRLLLSFQELFLVKGASADFFQLFFGMLELPGQIFFGVFGNRHGVVEGHVDDDAGNVQLGGQVFIPLEQRITDVVAGDDQIRQGKKGRREVIQLFRRLPGQGLALHQFHIAHVHAAIGAGVYIVALLIGNFEQGHGAFTRANGCGMVFRVDHGNVHGHA